MENTKNCPACNIPLQRFEEGSADGWLVELTVDDVVRQHVIERLVVAVVYACPRCEHVEGGAEEQIAMKPMTKVAAEYFETVGALGGRPRKDGTQKRRIRTPKIPASAVAILAENGALGGSSTSEAKGDAARKNGQKGGRPRKVPAV